MSDEKVSDIQSPRGYGLEAKNVPEGFVAVGVDNEAWINHYDERNDIYRWVKVSKADEIFMHKDGTPPGKSPKRKAEEMVEKVYGKGSKRTNKARKEESPTKLQKSGKVQTNSGLLWLGDPLELFIYAQKHSLDYFLKEISKKDLTKKQVYTTAKGLTWSGVDVQAKPVYSSEKPGERVPESICVMFGEK